MTRVAIKDEYVETLSALGDLEGAIDLAIQRYTIEQIMTRMNELRKRDGIYQAKYGMDYPAFARRVSKSESFISQLETGGNKLWENDLADWEFCYKGIDDWTQKLKNILMV